MHKEELYSMVDKGKSRRRLALMVALALSTGGDADLGGRRHDLGHVEGVCGGDA